MADAVKNDYLGKLEGSSRKQLRRGRFDNDNNSRERGRLSLPFRRRLEEAPDARAVPGVAPARHGTARLLRPQSREARRHFRLRRLRTAAVQVSREVRE